MPEEEPKMSENYEHLIKPLGRSIMDCEKEARAASVIGPGGAKKELWLNGNDHLEGLNLSFSWGVHTTHGQWHSGSKPHTHPYPECLFFVGLDTANINYLGAEIECGIGQELYTFNDPTVLTIPAGVPHGPITTKRLFSPRGFGFFSVALNPAFDIQWVARDQSDTNPPSQQHHAHLVQTLKSGVIIERKKLNPAKFTPEEIAQRLEMQQRTGFKPGPGNADHMAWMNGKDLGGLKLNVAWGFSSQPGIWQRGVQAHVHPEDEVLVFLGTDPDRIDYLGAEIEMDFGAEHERHLFQTSSAIVCPAGVPHGPIVTRWVDKPFAFLLINLADEVTMTFQ